MMIAAYRAFGSGACRRRVTAEPCIYLVRSVFGCWCLIAACISAAQPVVEASVRAHFEAAQQAQQAQRYAQAEKEYRAVLVLQPSFAEAHMNLGLVYQLQNRLAEATAEFQQALKTNPQLVGANFFLGVDLTRTGEGGKAIPYLRAAVEKEQKRADIRIWLATALEMTGDIKEEVQTLDRALELQANNVDLLYLLGHAFEILGKHEAAQLEKRSPQSVQAELLLAESYAESSEWPTAVIHFENAIAAAPASLRSHVELGEVLLRAGKLPRALQEFDEELKLDPHSVRGLVRRGEARLVEGNVDRSLADWTDALATDQPQVKRVLGFETTTLGGTASDQLQEAWLERMELLVPALRADHIPAAHLALAFLAAQRGSTTQSDAEILTLSENASPLAVCNQDAVQQAMRVDHISPFIPCMLSLLKQEMPDGFNLRLAGALLDARKYQASLEALDRLSRHDADSADATYLRARCYEALATAAYLRLYQADRNSYRVHQLLGDLASANGNDVKALSEYRMAIDLKPGLSNLHYSLGHLLWKNSKVSEARTELEAELALNPHHAGALNDLGQTYLLEQQPDKALLYLDRARGEGLSTSEMHRDLGTAYSELGDFSQASRELNFALPNDRDGSIHFKLARVYKAQGEKEKAAQAFSAAAALNRSFHQTAEQQTARRAQIEK